MELAKGSVNVEQLSENYASYLKIEMDKDVKGIEENIDDMLTRLEEFSGIMNMMSSEIQKCHDVCIPDLFRIKDKLYNFFRHIHMLEALVGRVHQDLNVVESQVVEAELDIGVSDGLLKNILKPLFSIKGGDRGKPESTSSRKKPQLVYEPPIIFKTSDFFPSPNDNE